jgi:hypothetical protein
MEKSTKNFRSQLELTALTGSAPRDSAVNPTAVDWSALTDDEKSAAWEKVRRYYDARIGKGVTIQSLATNQSWFASRASDCVDDFICLSWEQLQRTRGFGKKGSGANFKKGRRADPGALGERESFACQIGPKLKLCTRSV